MRDKDHRYFYANAAMIDLLDLADEFNINGKLVTDISHEMSVFSEEIYKYDELVIVNKNKGYVCVKCCTSNRPKASFSKIKGLIRIL